MVLKIDVPDSCFVALLVIGRIVEQGGIAKTWGGKNNAIGLSSFNQVDESFAFWVSNVIHGGRKGAKI